MKKIVINTCFGGFGLSEEAYERLIELGVPVRKYIEEKRAEDGLYKPVPENDGEVIFDNELTLPGESKFNDIYHQFKGKSQISNRYWESWTRGNREHPLVIQVVEELKDKANSFTAELKIVEIPNNIDYVIDEYDGLESIHEKHRSWN